MRKAVLFQAGREAGVLTPSVDQSCWLQSAAVQAEGAEVVIALTHMRVPNDRKLLKEVADIDVVLGGHDHHYEVRPTDRDSPAVT